MRNFIETISKATHNNHMETVRNKLTKSSQIVIFGATPFGCGVKKYLLDLGFQVVCFCDYRQNIVGTVLDGIEVVSIDYIAKYPNPLICLAADIASSKAVIYLKKMGFENYIDFHFFKERDHFNVIDIFKNINNIEEVYNLLKDPESKEIYLSIVEYRITADPMCLKISEFPIYFHPIVRPNPNTVVIDAGAHDGDTAIDFADLCRRKLTIYAFEPCDITYEKMLENIEQKQLENIIYPVKLGLWNETCKLPILSGGGQVSTNFANTNTIIDTIDLDTFTQNKNIISDLIKMDVEGSELNALEGSRRTISKYQPKLQISLYHRPNDLWEIPLWINRTNSKYHFYCGHHVHGEDREMWNIYETVLYASM